MHPLIEPYFYRLNLLHTDAEQALTDLPPEAFDWSPAPAVNSLTVLVMHTAGSERFWIGEVAGGDPAHRVRETEFQTKGMGADALKKRLAEVLAHSQTTFEKLSPEDLLIKHTLEDRDEVTTLAAIVHALEHVGIHVGHMQLMREWWLATAGKRM